jgi:hypothetical protein
LILLTEKNVLLTKDPIGYIFTTQLKEKEKQKKKKNGNRCQCHYVYCLAKLRLQYISPHSQLVICSCLIMIQLLLSLVWLAYERPAVDMFIYDRLIILKCQINKHSFLVSLIYNVLLVLICTMYAIRTRKVPENFNETKFIGFTCYTTCIIW